MTTRKPILWLASWYPNRYAEFDGDFIQRHARAVSELVPVVLLFVKKADASLPARVKIEKDHHGNLTEIIGYYKPHHTGIDVLNRLLSFLQYLRVFVTLIGDHIREHGVPELVHVHVTMRAGLLAYWLSKKYRVPYIITEHWTGFSSSAENNIYQQSWLQRYVTRKLLRQASLILPVCHYLMYEMKKLAPAVPFRVIENVADTAMFYPLQSNRQKLRFFHASSLNRQKSPEAMLRAFASVHGLGNDWEFVVAGPVTDDLRELTDNLGLGGMVTWLGEISYASVAQEMRKSDVLVMYSRFENLPCVIAEAHCCGLTVISNRVGGIPEMVDSSNGILVDNEGELSGALQKMITGYSVGDKHAIASKAAARYNYREIAARFESAYLQFMI